MARGKQDMLDLGLQGKVALITGGSDGLGRATAARLAGEGVRVAICARRGPHLEAAAAALRAQTGGEVLALTADVTQAADCLRAVEEAARAFGGVDILLNNAGPRRRTASRRWTMPPGRPTSISS
jgi:3-oxoacyl-[acyl-carrier protein] reductase